MEQQKQKAGNNAIQIQTDNLNINIMHSSNESAFQEQTDALSNLADEILMQMDEHTAMIPSRLQGDKKLNETAIFLLEEKGYVSISGNDCSKHDAIICFSMTRLGAIRKARLALTKHETEAQDHN